MSEIPIFESISFSLVRCDQNPNSCPWRKFLEKPEVTKYYCWHPESPEPNKEVIDGSYRQCVTEVKSNP